MHSTSIRDACVPSESLLPQRQQTALPFMTILTSASIRLDFPPPRCAPVPLHSLHELLMRPCAQIEPPLHSLQLLLMR